MCIWIFKKLFKYTWILNNSHVYFNESCIYFVLDVYVFIEYFIIYGYVDLWLRLPFAIVVLEQPNPNPNLNPFSIKLFLLWNLVNFFHKYNWRNLETKKIILVQLYMPSVFMRAYPGLSIQAVTIHISRFKTKYVLVFKYTRVLGLIHVYTHEFLDQIMDYRTARFCAKKVLDFAEKFYMLNFFVDSNNSVEPEGSCEILKKYRQVLFSDLTSPYLKQISYSFQKKWSNISRSSVFLFHFWEKEFNYFMRPVWLEFKKWHIPSKNSDSFATYFFKNCDNYSDKTWVENCHSFFSLHETYTWLTQYACPRKNPIFLQTQWWRPGSYGRHQNVRFGHFRWAERKIWNQWVDHSKPLIATIRMTFC